MSSTVPALEGQIKNSPAAQAHRPANPDFAPASSVFTGPVNVGFYERLLSATAGAGLAFYGATHLKRGGALLAALGGGLLYRGLSGHCSCYTALGLDRAEHNDATVIPAQQGEKIEKSVVIHRSPAELYSFWREVENLPRIMQHLEKVEPLDRTRSHWVAIGPLGKRVEWDAEIFNDRENEVIAWRSLPGSDVDTTGSVRFTKLSHDRGTAIDVSLKYNPPAGKFGAWAAWLVGQGLKGKIVEDLRAFKQFMEAGEIATGSHQRDGNPANLVRTRHTPSAESSSNAPRPASAAPFQEPT